MPDKHVVVCDDDEFVYFTVQTYMAKMGYKVHEAHAAEEGLNLIREHKPDIIFMDINMPGIDGYEACSQLKADPETADIPLVFVSAKDVSGGYEKEVKAGADYFVSKPFQPNDLAADLYFLAAARFRPDYTTLSRLRVCHPLVVERMKKRPKVSDLELQTAAVASGELESEKAEPSAPVEEAVPHKEPQARPSEVSAAEFKKVRMLVMAVAKRLENIEKLLIQKGILGKGSVDEATRAAVWGAALKQNEKELNQMKHSRTPQEEDQGPSV